MCGIFGFLDHQSDRIPQESSLRESAALLKHRGPDDQSVFLGPSAGLVHTRLSLVDLDPRSNQPFWDKTGRYALVYNGEIYNFHELRRELEAKGVVFRTTSDTEVVLESLLHSEYIEETLVRMEGMFAFALYDRVEKTLVLARDRVGMKPLYIYDDGSRFVFSSEVQAMRPWIPWQADKLMVSPYLSGLHGVPEGYGLYEGVESVKPGSVVRVQRGAAPARTPFFQLSDFWDEDERERLSRLTPEQAVDLVEQKLLASVKMQLRADAPLGVFCSGGVDSSLIAAMTARLHGDLTIFHSNIVGKASEYEAAKALADHLGLRFITKDVHDNNYLERIPDVVQFAEYPYRHLPTSPPFLMLSETAKEHGVKGLLTGEGSDECFLGYPHHTTNVMRLARQLPRESYLMLKKALKGFPKTGPAPMTDFSARFQQHFRLELEREGIEKALREKTGGKLKKNQLFTLFDFTDNIRALNHRNDSMGMAAGVECRFPFLDSDVIRTGVNLPEKYKLPVSPTAMDPEHPFICDKWVIRQVADRYLPKKLSRRVKTPWPTTFHERMEISPRFFHEGSLQAWLKMTDRQTDYFMAHAPHSLKTTLMYLEVWAHLCFYRKPKEAILRRLKECVRVRPEQWTPRRMAAPRTASPLSRLSRIAVFSNFFTG
jgi:asparagine synthase (glutamine-hydrolysing)